MKCGEPFAKSMIARAVVAAIAVVLTVAATACSLFVSLDGLDDGSGCKTNCGDASDFDGGILDANGDSTIANADADASTDSGKNPGDGGCPSAQGPTMVAAAGFCVDSTETTAADYAVFYSAIGGATGAIARPQECAWKSTTNVGCAASAQFPIACVDWCDAFAYCAWAGKRLCGAVPDGGALDYALAGDRTASEWSAGCSPTGDAYPYGATFEPGACNTKYVDGGNAPATVPVASFPECVGGVPGLYDMAGNVQEWIASCDAHDGGTPSDNCHEGGDNFRNALSGIARCDNADFDSRSFNSAGVGIRCCANSP